MTDFILLEKLYTMVNDIPKPTLFHRKGLRASGYFRPYMDLGDYTKAHIFSSNDIVTPVDIRFSSMLGDDGTADTRRNIKGMEIKFNDIDCQYDMFCRSLPVMFIRDKDKLISLIDAFSTGKPFDKINNYKLWAFVCDNPQALNCMLRLYSAYGLVDSFVNIDWFSVNQFIWINRSNNKTLVKYRWAPINDYADKNRNSKLLTRIKAEFISGYDPDRALNELKNSIDEQKYPTFELQIQMIDMNRCFNKQYFDRTLVWSEDEIPYKAVGILKINKYYENLYDGAKLVHSGCNNIDGIKVLGDELSRINGYLTMLETSERG